MKRIKSIILSGAILMAALMAGTVAQADNAGSIQQFIITQSPSGEAGGEFTMNPDGSFQFSVNCPILDLEGVVKGNSSMVATGRNDGEVEIIDSMTASWTLSNPQKGSISNTGSLQAISHSYSPSESGVFYVNCVCSGSVSGKWLGTPVSHVFCNCLYELTVTSQDADGTVHGTVRCVSCTSTLT